MATTELGRTGLHTGRVGLGTVKLGRNTDVKYPQDFDLPTEAEVERLLEAAWDMGVRFYDTAPAYGSSEERLAPFVRRHRDEMVLCSKAGEEYGPEGSHYRFDAQHLEASLERSLQRLGTDHLDLWLLHSDGRDREILEQSDAVPTLLRCKKAGKVRAVGISAKTENGVRGAIAALDVVMAPYSLAQPELAGALLEAHAADLGILAIKGLGSGHLAARDATTATQALEHVFSRPFLDCLVLGTLDPTHLAQAVDLAATVEPSPE